MPHTWTPCCLGGWGRRTTDWKPAWATETLLKSKQVNRDVFSTAQVVSNTAGEKKNISVFFSNGDTAHIHSLCWSVFQWVCVHCVVQPSPLAVSRTFLSRWSQAHMHSPNSLFHLPVSACSEQLMPVESHSHGMWVWFHSISLMFSRLL